MRVMGRTQGPTYHLLGPASISFSVSRSTDPARQTLLLTSSPVSVPIQPVSSPQGNNRRLGSLAISLLPSGDRAGPAIPPSGCPRLTSAASPKRPRDVPKARHGLAPSLSLLQPPSSGEKQHGRMCEPRQRRHGQVFRGAKVMGQSSQGGWRLGSRISEK